MKRHKKVAYPLVACDTHPRDRAPGYVACKHAIDDPALVVYREEPTRSQCGVVACGPCDAIKTTDHMLLICARCAHEKFGAPPAPQADA